MTCKKGGDAVPLPPLRRKIREFRPTGHLHRRQAVPQEIRGIGVLVHQFSDEQILFQIDTVCMDAKMPRSCGTDPVRLSGDQRSDMEESVFRAHGLYRHIPRVMGKLRHKYAAECQPDAGTGGTGEHAAVMAASVSRSASLPALRQVHGVCLSPDGADRTWREIQYPSEIT